MGPVLKYKIFGFPSITTELSSVLCCFLPSFLGFSECPTLYSVLVNWWAGTISVPTGPHTVSPSLATSMYSQQPRLLTEHSYLFNNRLRDLITELTRSTYPSDFVDMKMPYFNHSQKICIGWNMKQGVTGAINSLVKTWNRRKNVFHGLQRSRLCHRNGISLQR